METQVPSKAPSKALFYTGWVLSLLPVALLIMSGVMKILQPPVVIEGNAHLGWPNTLAIPLAVIELGAVLIYLIPQTALLGAILLTGYLGGATAAHVRIEEAFFMPILVGVFVWLGLYLREPRLRSVIPFRSLNKS